MQPEAQVPDLRVLREELRFKLAARSRRLEREPWSSYEKAVRKWCGPDDGEYANS